MATVPNFSQPVIFSEVATPTVPDSGYLKVYAKSGTLYSIANGGSEKAYVVSTDLSSYLPLAGGTLVGDLLFTDATYDIGKSGATRPRDGWFSRKLNVGSGISLVDNTASGWGYALLFDGTNSGVENGQGAGLGLILRGNTVCLAANNLRGLYGSSNLVLGQTDGPYVQVGGAGVASTSNAYNRITTHSSDGLHVFNHTLTSAAKLGVYETWTSSTSFGAFQIKANAGAAYQIGSAIGSAGGTNREVQIGHWSSAGVFTPALYIGTAGRIGIGTSPANYRWLDITGSETTGNGVQVCITNTATDGYSTAVLNFRTGASGVGGNISGFATNFANYGVTNGLNFSGATSTDNIAFRTGSALLSGSGVAARFFISSNGNIGVNTQSPTSLLHVIGLAQTALTASTESIEINFDLSSTKQFATGALTTQRAFRIQAPTYSFVGASTITTASTVSISGAPAAGTNATITNAYALEISSGRIGFTGGFGTGGIYFAGAGAYYAPHISTGSNQLVIAAQSQVNWIFSNSQYMQFYNGNIATTGSIELGGSTSGTGDVILLRDAANTFAQRNSTNAQTLRVYNTYTSSTSYELINIKGKASANFEIGPENGSAGGTLRGLTIGGYSAGSSTITPWMSFTGSTGELGIFGNGVVRQNKYGDDATAAIYTFRKYRGTESVPTEVQSGDLIGQILFQGYHGSTIGTSAAIQVIATEAFTSAPNRPTRMAFNTTAPGDTQSSIRMTITDVGTTWFGSYSTSYTNSGLVGIAGSNASGAENNTLLFRDNSTLNGIGQVLGKIAFWSADTTSPGAGVKAWISCVSESATVANAAIVFATDTTTGTPTEQMRITSGGNVGIGTGSTVSARTHVISTTEQLRIGYDSGDYYSTTVSSTGAVTFDAVGSAPLFAFSKLVGQSAAEITNTPAATSQTITLNNGNHQTLTLTSATGTVAVTLTVPSKVSSGTIIVKQHATTPRNITWAVSAGTIKWMGTQPAWSSDGVTEIRIVSWRYDGSVMYLMSTDVAS